MCTQLIALTEHLSWAISVMNNLPEHFELGYFSDEQFNYSRGCSYMRGLSCYLVTQCFAWCVQHQCYELINLIMTTRMSSYVIMKRTWYFKIDLFDCGNLLAMVGRMVAKHRTKALESLTLLLTFVLAAVYRVQTKWVAVYSFRSTYRFVWNNGCVPSSIKGDLLSYLVFRTVHPTCVVVNFPAELLTE